MCGYPSVPFTNRLVCIHRSICLNYNCMCMLGTAGEKGRVSFQSPRSQVVDQERMRSEDDFTWFGSVLRVAVGALTLLAE